MKKFIYSLLIVVGLLSTYSCSNDGYSLDNFEIHYVTIVVPQEGNPNNSFYLEDVALDKKYWVAAPLYVNNTLKNGQRAIANITLLSGKDGEYDHYVRLNSIDKVLTKDAVKVPVNEAEKYGSEIVGLFSNVMYPGVELDGNYVNVAFTAFFPSKESHVISLIQVDKPVDSEELDDKYLHLELRYNSHGDELKNYVLGRASFDLSNLLPAEVNPYKGVKILRKKPDTGEEIITLNWAEEQSKSN